MEENPALLTEIRDELGEIKQTATDLRESVAELAKSMRRSRRWAWALTAVIVAQTLLGAGLVVVAWRNYTNLNCVRDWANATSSRNTTLAAASNQRIAAEDQLFRDAGATHPDKATVAADYHIYLAAAAEYRKAVQANPVPQSYNCHSF